VRMDLMLRRRAESIANFVPGLGFVVDSSQKRQGPPISTLARIPTSQGRRSLMQLLVAFEDSRHSVAKKFKVAGERAVMSKYVIAQGKLIVYHKQEFDDIQERFIYVSEAFLC